MIEKKLNCWEFKKCGREPNGSNVLEMGICPAVLDHSFDGTNRGKNGGRICWAVAGTFCDGEKQGPFHAKRDSCIKCDFFQLVSRQEEESDNPTKLLKFLLDTLDDSFLEELKYISIRAGERFLVQGTRGETAYIIQEGTCLTVVEKNGELYPAGHWGKGDIVGILGLFTGEPSEAHAEAETDMNLWVLNKHQIDNMSHNNPELLSLVTEIVASQFDSKRPVADRKIGKYILTDIIGRGAYSIVYKAIHKDLRMAVAVKMMRHHMVVDHSFLLHFKNEAQIIASLNHDNILKVYDFEERYKTVFIISEYLEGESLQDLLARLRVIPQLLALKIIYQVCAGLRYAHDKGIVHRDINPANIMVLPDDRVKILDFGLACEIGTEDEQIGGAFAYQAPELLEGSQADQSSDIYALGITAFELVTGKKPFSNREITEMYQSHKERILPDPIVCKPDIIPKLREFILKATQHREKKRYHNAAEAINTLGAENTYPNKLIKKNHEISTTITLSCEYQQQDDFDRLIEDFSRRSNDLNLSFSVNNTKVK
ncbi:protein kinase [Desulforhopalus sp. IMCC35007]|uniref:protein kinase domain-containing protein n=1 Tax=Desulforhopalus sp. IMCC35007 TaxID=2569543 RepID=UPI00145F25EC|nr:protein kinase [Desulforhopalus sp. IMCC35007]